MIQEILMTLLTPDVDSEPLADFLSSEVSTELLHPCERAILSDIIGISVQHKSIAQFILQYSTHGRHQIHASSAIDAANIIDEPLQKGLYVQALADGIDKVLDEYRDAIVDLEHRYLRTPDYSLIFVYETISSFEPLLQFLLRFIQGVKAQRMHGCALMQYIQQHSMHGNDQIVESVQIIQRCVHIVFLKQLSQFIIYGKFTDEYGEFFIQHAEHKNGTVGSGSYHTSTTTTTTTAAGQSSCITAAAAAATTISDGASVQPDLWPYEICYDLMPHFFSHNWADKVLFIGETVCMFNAHRAAVKKPGVWQQQQHPMDELYDPLGGSLWDNKEHIYFNKIQMIYTDTQHQLKLSNYENTIDEIKNYISKRLSEIAINQSDLIKQLQLIKDFYLLGRGEMYLEFIKQTRGILDMSVVDENVARDISRAFEAAAHSVNVGDDLEQISLSVSIDDSEASTLGRNSFIDGLSLHYKDKWPLHLLFSQKIIEGYNGMFRFLLQIKRVQFGLHEVWCDHREWQTKRCSVLLQLRNKLMFVVDNLQYYLQVDVLEAQFSGLMQIVQSSSDFEHIKRAHAIFQANVLSLCFLLSSHEQPMTASMSASVMNANVDGIENPVLTILQKILAQTLLFCRLSARCGGGQTSREQQLELEQLDVTFTDLVNDLMKLLTGLKAGPSSAPLAQLLLRLDFNYWFSSQQIHQTG